MKRAVLICIIAILGYGAWPYIAIAQIGNAVQGGDVATLEKRVAWAEVRGHLKKDLSEKVATNIQAQANQSGNALGGLLANVLAPTVSSGVVDSLVEATVTPQVVAGLAERRPEQSADEVDAEREEMLKDPLKHVQWAFFSGLTTFEARVRPDRGEPVTQFNFELQGLNWKLVRVIPPEDFSLNAG